MNVNSLGLESDFRNQYKQFKNGIQNQNQKRNRKKLEN